MGQTEIIRYVPQTDVCQHCGGKVTSMLNGGRTEWSHDYAGDADHIVVLEDEDAPEIESDLDYWESKGYDAWDLANDR